MLGIDKDGMKKVLTITIGENESAKYWMTVLNELKNRGVQDILVLCADGLTGLKDAISAIYPKTEYQRCIVHQIRNSLKYVPYTDRKELANDLKTVYKASTEELGYTNLLELEEKWKHKYPGAFQEKIVVCGFARRAGKTGLANPFFISSGKWQEPLCGR